MRLLWWFTLVFWLVSVVFLTRAIFVHRRTRIPLPPSLVGGIALNGGLLLLIVPNLVAIPSALKWLALAGSLLLVVYSLRLSRRALAREP
jgi:hypothetical protein